MIENLSNCFEPWVERFYRNQVKLLPPSVRMLDPLLKKSFTRNVLRFGNELLLPGDLGHILARKYFASSVIQNFVKNNHGQLLHLGSGFDHSSLLCARLGMHTFEMDFLPVNSQQENHDWLKEYIHDPNYFHSTSLDLTMENPVQKLLQTPDFDPYKPTLILTHGLFEYLPEMTIHRLVNQISRQISGPLTWHTTLFDLFGMTPIRRKILTTAVNSVGEKVIYYDSISKQMSMFRKQGWALQEKLDANKMSRILRKQTGVNTKILPGFYVMKYSPPPLV